MASESSQFWIKKPTVSLTKVSGLNTLISGYKIELSPKYKTQEEYDKGNYKNYFTGLDTQPTDEYDDNGYYVTLIASEKENIELNTPIFIINIKLERLYQKSLGMKKFI